MGNTTISTGIAQSNSNINCNHELLNISEVKKITKLSKPTIYRLMKYGEFPRPKQLSSNRVAWRNSDVDNWLANLSKSRGLANG